jgi:AraC-like DNA-binding protein
VDDDLLPYVNCIMTGESFDPQSNTKIPLYADGYPGIMYQKSENGFYLFPQNKKLSELFLYGQTLEPVSLEVTGLHKHIVVQLYPFASKYLLNVDPKKLNNDCYDLLNIEYFNIDDFRIKLANSTDTNEQIRIISDLMRQLIKTHKIRENDSVQNAISLIIKHKGRLKIKDLVERVFTTERTLERNFDTHIGLTPKQFSKIMQFQSAISNLTQSSYNSLISIGIDSGFSDQSHFIRTFKRYTGQTPSFYLKQLNKG